MRVDVVTAVHADYASFLPDAYRSLRDQTHPDWRWFVQFDGWDDAGVTAALAVTGALSDDRVSFAGNGESAGPAVTRNIALARTGAPYVQNLDADDELEPAALTTLLAALRAAPSAGFAAGHARDLLPGGSLRDHPLPVSPGPLPRGKLAEEWLRDPTRPPPIHPAGVLWHRELVVELGGWTALHGMEDTGLLMAASAVADGVLADAATLRYRKHPRQLSRRRETSKFAGGGAHRTLVRQRVELLSRGPAWNHR
ncbi:glycosyltransferase family A protein [Amycolatopsis suaedae]|uniref:Glycosyltransferase family 2 protein n=1 Tax=Amycolatopsis suaedae TaxID=2510978 RepID=A0A4Q7JCZ7_9PSEU|nr:glycosyltransferase family A protein [Amycolatopsis suaedae]RZQ65781.1 glycosyltransferase family 2 protein [Amycolatopsis suaedae]